MDTKLEFRNWLKRRIKTNPSFAVYKKYLEGCFSMIIESVSFMKGLQDRGLQQGGVYFSLSAKHLYFNFINLLEIMLNEIRKKDLAIGLYEYNSLDKEDKKKCIDPMLLKDISDSVK